MPEIRLKSINNFILKNANLQIRDKEFLVLWGKTGAGKTTLLNVVAGLAEYKGSVLFDGIAVDELSVRQRKISYLFQNLNLFPHLNVRENIGYGLWMRGESKKAIHSRVDEMLDLTDIEHLAGCYPQKLSGGEKQRVALARAMAPCFKIMLFDEPLNSLDFHTARFIRKEIYRLQKKSGITVVYVTHCFEEVFALADRIAVLNNGEIIQVDCPVNIFQENNCRAVSEKGYCDCHSEEKNKSTDLELKHTGVLCHSKNG
ncbi:MAG: ABC transporter ATP-binding protein [Candidatus Aureabacteria bacterium]|nr:ABC transporter ATP-binding protein [Candidatus Auribacterota bacterium]